MENKSNGRRVMGHDPCHGNGALRADGTCDCDRLYTGEDCDQSFRDACGGAWSVAQGGFLFIYLSFLWHILQQLQAMAARKQHSTGGAMAYRTMVCLCLCSVCRALWLIDPYGFMGPMSDFQVFNAVLNTAANMFSVLASMFTIAHWRRILLAGQAAYANVLNRRLYWAIFASWIIIFLANVGLAVHFTVTGSELSALVLNTTMSMVTLSMSAVILTAAKRLKGAIAPLAATEQRRVVRLVNMVNLWSLQGVAGLLITGAMLVYVILRLSRDPWAHFVIIMVLVRLLVLLLQVVLFVATAQGPCPRATAVMTLMLRGLGLWVSTATVAPMSSPPPASAVPPALVSPFTPAGVQGLAPGLAPELSGMESTAGNGNSSSAPRSWRLWSYLQSVRTSQPSRSD